MAKRMTAAYLVVGDPDLDNATECPACGFDSLLSFPVVSLTENGVSDMGTVSACPRCYVDSDD